MSSLRYSAVAIAFLVACGTSKSDDKAPSPTATATDARTKKRTPRGAAAYPKDTVNDTADRAEFEALEAVVVAISVDAPATSAKLRAKLGTSAPLYADEGGAASKAYGVYDADTEISIASTFVVAKGGRLVYRYIGSNKADRPPIDDVLAAISASR